MPLTVEINAEHPSFSAAEAGMLASSRARLDDPTMLCLQYNGSETGLSAGGQTDGAPGVGCADLPVYFRDICFCQVLVPPNTCPCVQNEMLKTLSENINEVYRHRREKCLQSQYPWLTLISSINS